MHICIKQMWPSLIAKAKRGGLDVIQTYVFWNLHEPKQGQVGWFFLLQTHQLIKSLWSGLVFSLNE